MQIPLSVLKPILIDLCRQFHEQQTGSDERFAIPIVERETKKHVKYISGIINIVQNSLTSTFFGAFITIENYECSLPSGTGIAEFRIVLTERTMNVAYQVELALRSLG